MKSRTLIVCAFVFALVLVSCKSNERKAEGLIRTELSKTLLDFSSYEPIETIVGEAYENAYNDAWCFHQAMIICRHVKMLNKYVDEMSDAQESMNIWGAPSYYSSSYSDSQYYKYKEQAEEHRGKVQEELASIRMLGRELQDSVSSLDPQKIIGWEVKHRFRCKTRGGQSTIADYRYIVDEKFENVILYEDLDDDDYSDVRECLELAVENGFDKMFE